MNRIQTFAVLTAGVFVGVASCSDSTNPVSDLVADSTVTANVATSSGDAMASVVETMLANEVAVSLPYVANGPLNSAIASIEPTVTRTKTCYDANGLVVANCQPIASVRKIISHVTIDGNRSGTSSTTGGPTRTFTGAFHRVADDTVVRNFTGQPPAEVSRTHNGMSVAHDTTTFTEGDNSFNMREAAHDAAVSLVWNVPRSQNPWPVSGKVVRTDTVHAVGTRGSTTQTRDDVHTIEIDFPADAQGNVVLKIDARTCNLNLVTHAVTNCH